MNPSKINNCEWSSVLWKEQKREFPSKVLPGMREKAKRCQEAAGGRATMRGYIKLIIVEIVCRCPSFKPVVNFLFWLFRLRGV